MNPLFVSMLCAIRYETCQHFYHCHVWCHELFGSYAKKQNKLNFFLRLQFLSVYIFEKISGIYI